MSSQASKSAPRNAKPTSSQTQQPPTSRSSSLAAHLAMVELKQRILTSLSKLADRDTHQIALEDLQSITTSLSPETLPMLLNSLYDTLSDQSTAKPSVKKESLNLLGLVCQTHRELTLPHLTKVITHIVKRLKDSDSGVRDACRDAIGVLSGLYLGEGGGGDGNAAGGASMVGLFVRPLFEAMGEQNKVVQAGASTCMARMIECAAAVDKDGGSGGAPVAAFQKLCPRICKLLSGQNFVAKAALLGVVASLSQVGAVAPQSFPSLLQSIHDCLSSADWATRKAGAEALSAIAAHSCSLVSEEAADSILTALEACRFDKIKPVRDSMNEALQLWKKIAGKGGDGVSDDQKASSPGGEDRETAELLDKNLNTKNRVESSTRGSPNGSSPTTDSAAEAKAGSIPDKAVVILKKKAPALTDKEVNPEFFHKLETRASGDVEVVVSRRCVNTSSLNNEEEPESKNMESKARSDHTANSKSDELYFNNKYRIGDRGISGRDSRSRAFDDEINSRETTTADRAGLSKVEGQSEGSLANSRGNWLAMQRQLLQLERQQTHLMHMLQDFMGGSHDSMVTLENRARGLERVVEDMARDLSMSAARRGGGFPLAFEGTSSNRSLGKYNGLSDYSSPNYNGRVPFGDRFAQSDVIGRGRNPHWRGEPSDIRDNFPSYGSSRNGHHGGSRRGSPKSDHENDQQVGSRRGWDKGGGPPSRLGEGPSARSVWQASKDEATLEAIRVAGEEDREVSRTARVAIPELTAEAMINDNVEQERDPVWTSWMNAMDALKVGDIDTAYAEVTSTGDDQLLVKIMDRTGPVVDQLTSETACEVLHGIAQFLLDHNLFDISFSWIHQLVDVVVENGPDVMGIPMELKRELLLNLHEASTTMEMPEDWEGVDPEQLLLQLASAWRIELQQFDK